ncbi:MAG: hypothetical protein UV29_C0008G0015 [Candidatus Collierbacteria bacterium GW2011_GWD2_42_50]|nr:MAG: hypothetical protein UV29_C0008G0015 [Candidatus Collierbacteria bacterium GW2011_GWD2_42_50]
MSQTTLKESGAVSTRKKSDFNIDRTNIFDTTTIGTDFCLENVFSGQVTKHVVGGFGDVTTVVFWVSNNDSVNYFSSLSASFSSFVFEKFGKVTNFVFNKFFDFGIDFDRSNDAFSFTICFGKFINALSNRINKFLSKRQSTGYFFFTNFVSSGFDHTDSTLGTGNDQV